MAHHSGFRCIFRIKERRARKGQGVEFEACNLSGFPDYRGTSYISDMDSFLSFSLITSQKMN